MNPGFSPIFADPFVVSRFSASAVFDDFLAFERALTAAFGATARIDPVAAEEAVAAMAGFSPDLERIALATLEDGMPMPEYVRQLRVHAAPALAESIHTGSTSQDLTDTSMSLALRDINRVLGERLEALLGALGACLAKNGSRALMGRTRMQAALPITVGDRVRNWSAAVEEARDDLVRLRPRVEVIQLGGPVGTREGFGERAEEIAQLVADELGLGNPGRSWHTVRGRLADYCGWCAALTGALGKIGQDVALMAQQGIDDIRLAGGGTSSAMGHKKNPVRAELLVAFARYNAGLLGTFHQALVHEQERSGTAWALEWMTVPAIVNCAARALGMALELVESIEAMGTSRVLERPAGSSH